jgi:DNA-binding response OmpR family regulator
MSLQRRPSGTPAARGRSPLTRLLVVNDDMDMRPALARQLAARLGCTVETAGSVEAALGTCASHPPEAVLVDSAALLSCVQLVRGLRATPAGSGLAIVVLLGQHTREDELFLRGAGADACLPTPVAAAEIARVLLGLTMMRSAQGGSRR